jgi:predicted nucleic acid-binding protein
VNAAVAYLDSSALVKLVFAESESAALRGFLAEWRRRASSVLARTEVARVANRLHASDDARARAEAVLEHISLVGLDDAILKRAGEVEPETLRTLDAIHLATALSLGDDLGGMVTYDRRLADAARRAGLTVWSPR